MSNQEIDLDFIRACLREAGELALALREVRERGQMAFALKADRTPVTAVDRQVEKLLIERIQARYPDHLILSEESGLHPGNTQAGESEYAWALDPIDGTRAFASGLPVWGISAGVLRNGRPYAGSFYLPMTGELYSGTTEAAWYNRQRLPRLEGVDPFSPLAFLAVPSEFHLQFKVTAPRIRSMGSTAAHLAYVASGAAAGMLTRSTSLWDIAGVLPLAQAAGVELRYLSGRPFDPAELLGGESIHEPLLASHPAVFEVLRGWIQVNPAG